jgi:hypothetical protein
MYSVWGRGTCGKGGGMEEMKVKEDDWWASYTYMKSNDETSCHCFKCGREGFVGRR